MPRRHFRYKTQSFYFPANLSSAQQLRLEAVVTFLQQQPEVLNELFSGKDFEFLWQAAIYFSRASSTENEPMNIPTQQIKLPHETSIQWTRSRVPLRTYLLQRIFHIFATKAASSPMPYSGKCSGSPFSTL